MQLSLKTGEVKKTAARSKDCLLSVSATRLKLWKISQVPQQDPRLSRQQQIITLQVTVWQDLSSSCLKSKRWHNRLALTHSSLHQVLPHQRKGRFYHQQLMVAVQTSSPYAQSIELISSNSTMTADSKVIRAWDCTLTSRGYMLKHQLMPHHRTRGLAPSNLSTN